MPVPEVVTLGEAMVLLLAEQAGPLEEASTFRRHVAGAEANVAIGLCRLGHSAAFVSRVGDDAFGRAVVRRLRGEGVDVRAVRVDPGAPTGLIVRERREAGPLDVAYYRAGSAASRLAPDDLDEALIRSARVLHLTGITPALSSSARAATFAAAEIARAAGVRVVLDPNVRRKLWSAGEARETLRDLAGLCDLVLPGEDEATLLTGETDAEAAARTLLALGPSEVLVKGAAGAWLVRQDSVLHVPTEPLGRVVDPVGAGDAFAAGYLAGCLRGLDEWATVKLAHRCGAAVMQVVGDQEGLPRWSDVSGTFAGDVRR